MVGQTSRPSVLLISVDALKPEFVFEQERLGIKLPNITKYFVEKGLTAPKGMKSVFPTFTYPCHQSMITGTNPATHGIVNNGIYDPTGAHRGAWHWFANTKVLTLWEGAKRGRPAWPSPPASAPGVTSWRRSSGGTARSWTVCSSTP